MRYPLCHPPRPVRGRLSAVRGKLDRQLERERVERVAVGGLPVVLFQLGPFRYCPFPDALAPVRPVQEGTDRGAQPVDAGPVRVPGQGGPFPLAGLGFAVRPRYRVGVDLGRQFVIRVLAQVGLDQFARLAWMSTDRDRADHFEPLPGIAVSIRPGEQLTGIPVLGLLVPGAVRRPRGNGERPGPRRFWRTRQHQPRDLGRLPGRGTEAHPRLHQGAGDDRVGQFRRQQSGYFRGAGLRVEQPAVAFGQLLLTFGPDPQPRLLGTPGLGLGTILLLAAAALGHGHPSPSGIRLRQLDRVSTSSPVRQRLTSSSRTAPDPGTST